MKKIRGTPAYWECTMRDLFAMVRQLGIPTWFCSFSAADRRWSEIDEAILEQQGKPIPDTIDWETHCKIIASNPVTAARMFEHRVQSFITQVILSPAQPIGHVIDYFYRVEFQQRGWPHIHCLFWVKDAPLYGQSPTEEIEQFIDRYISCKLPSESTEPQLYEKVQNLQMHSKNHSRSCRKGNKTCRFHFPRVPSKRTFISKPRSQDSDDNIVHGFSTAVQKLWDCILNNTFTASTNDEAFHKAGITQEQLENCIRAKTNKDTVFLKRQPVDIWVNNYNPTLLEAWNANMDIQFVLDAYSCIMYIVSYISKSEREMGDLLKASQQEAREGNIKPMEELRKLGSVYLNHREVSVMEAIYRVTGMHMKQSSRQVVFIPTDPDCQRLSMPLHELRKKQEDTDNIWLSNLVDKYLQRPKQLQSICLATFASEYRYAGQHSTSEQALTLGNNLGTVIKRTNKHAIIRYPKVRIQKDTEKYYSNLIRLYLPTTQKELTPGTYTTFENYFLHASYNGTPVKEVIANNMRHFEPLAVELETLWESMQANPNQENSWADLAPQAELERIEQTELLLQTVDSIPPECTTLVSELQHTAPSNSSTTNLSIEQLPVFTSQDEITSMLRTLNSDQRQLFNYMHKWGKNLVLDKNTKPPYIFLTGGAGTGKSQLVRCITHELRKCFSKIAESPDDITVLLVAYTGTAAFNVQGQTIHSAFNIFKPTLPYQQLGQELLNTLQAKYRSLQLVIIDEISMVDQNMFLYIHGRLQQIKRTAHTAMFGNVAILAVGDFYQIPPVIGKPLFHKDDAMFIDLWSIFSLWELTVIMRQKDDISYAELLNRLRTHEKGTSLLPADIKILETRIVQHVTQDIPFIAARRAIVDTHNSNMLHSLGCKIEVIQAVDITSASNGTLKKLIKPYANARTTLPEEINIAVGALVMLTTNIDVSDGLVNGVTGKVTGIIHGNQPNGQPEAVGILFDNATVGAKYKRKYPPPANIDKASIILKPHKEIFKAKTQYITRHQYPIKLAWAFTIHKVQGMTLEKATISLDGIFQAGMAYVALSRVPSLQGLQLKDFDPSLIYCNRLVQNTMLNMTKCNVQSANELLYTDMNFTVLHHNTQSLFCHHEDITSNPEFMNTDIICLTETCISCDNMKYLAIPEYELLCSDKQRRGQGVAIYIKRKHMFINVPLQTGRCSSLLIATKTCPSFSILVMYRPPSVSLSNFITDLENAVQHMKQYDKIYRTEHKIIVGDLNYDLMKYPPIKQLSAGFKQVITSPTTTSGTLLDHIYVSDTLLHYACGTLNTYYSYHEPVYLATNIAI